MSAVSIVLLGSRDFVKGSMDLRRLIAIGLDWRFLIGGVLALMARFLFVWTNNLVDKLEGLSGRSTTITTLINSLGVVLVVVFNVVFLKERLTVIQVVGVGLVVVGVSLVAGR